MAEEKSIKPLQNFLTKENIETLVKNHLGPTTELVDYHVKSYSENVVGFMGAHWHLTVRISKQNGTTEETRTYFVKSLPTNVLQASLLQEGNIFHKETTFYQHILPELTSSINDSTWCSKCYFVGDNVMVMEDLRVRNFSLKNRILDTAYLKSALTALAKLHASSVLVEKRLGKTWIQLYPNVLMESMFQRVGNVGSWFRTGVDVAVAVAKKLGLDATFVAAVCDRIFKSISASGTRRNVICHGDAWSFNFMFDDSRPLPNCVMVDYQIVRYAPAMVDVAQLLYLSTRREFRERNEEELLRHYHGVFAETLMNNGKEMDVPSFAELLQEYEERRVVGIVSAVMCLPVSSVDGEIGENLMKDVDGFARLVFRDRVDLVLDIMSKDSVYSDRIAESVTEMIERSKELLALSTD